jgi:hypothetical protein
MSKIETHAEGRQAFDRHGGFPGCTCDYDIWIDGGRLTAVHLPGCPLSNDAESETECGIRFTGGIVLNDDARKLPR